MELLLILGVIVVFCVIVLSLIGNVEGGWAENRKKKIVEIINQKGINVDKRHDSNLSETVLIHDSVSQNIWYVEFPKNASPSNLHIPNKVKKINYKDIVQVELKEDEHSIVVTSRTSQIGGAIVGGALAGGFGAVIGGLSGKQKQKREVKKIEMLLTLDDLKTPYLKMKIVEFDRPTSTNSYPYPEKYEEAFSWFKLMEVIIKRSEAKVN